MVFSTILFVFRFLPITLALYYLAPGKWKNLALFVCSLVFYSWGEVRLFPVMAAAILINYTAGLGIEKFGANPKLRKMCIRDRVQGEAEGVVQLEGVDAREDLFAALLGGGLHAARCV